MKTVTFKLHRIKFCKGAKDWNKIVAGIIKYQMNFICLVVIERCAFEEDIEFKLFLVDKKVEYNPAI